MQFQNCYSKSQNRAELEIEYKIENHSQKRTKTEKNKFSKRIRSLEHKIMIIRMQNIIQLSINRNKT